MSDSVPSIGIDFGTTNSSMAWFDPRTGRTELIKNQGEDKTPSMVFFGENETLVGKPVDELVEDASNDRLQREEVFRRTVTSIKRSLIAPPRIALPDAGRYVRPVEVVAEILKNLKYEAQEGHFHEEVRRAVVTCPAEFNVIQRRKIEEGGRLAGFEEVALIEEPAAAALAYARAGLKMGRHVLVYDLGGGTFDLAVLENEEGTFRVAMEPKGIDRCGGDDFDRALYYHCDELAREELGRPISLNGGVDLKFLRLCRRRKENLSWQERARFSNHLSSDNGLVRFEHEVERETFEGLIDPYVEETLLLTRQMLDEAGARGIEPDAAVLIGGSTRVPVVERRLAETLPVAPLKFDKAEVAVALGAACYADVLWPSSRPKPARSAESPAPTVESENTGDAKEEQRRREAEARVAEERRRREEREDKDGRMVGRPISEGDVAREEGFADTILDETVATPSTVEVPDLAGKNASQASSMLVNEGLTLGDQKEVPSDTVPEGEIVGQSPEAWTEVASDSSVSLTVSSGPEEATTVPSLSDRSTEEAKRASSNAGLVPAASRTEKERRVGPEDSSRQTARRATMRSGKRANLWIGAGLLCAVVAVGLIAALAYSLTGEDATEETEPVTTDSTPSSTLSGHSDAVSSVAFSPDGSLLASGSRDKTVKLWDPRSGELLRTLSGHSDVVSSVAFSPDGSLLASGGSGNDRTAKLWDPQSGEELRTLTGPGSVFSLAFSPDGRLLANGSSVDFVKLWDPQSGEELRTLSGHSGLVSSVAFGPDGSLLAVGSSDDTKLWDPQSGERLRTLTGPVAEVAFSPDGRLLASGSSGPDSDGTVKLWDPQSGEELRALSGHSSEVSSVAFSPDGRLLASGSRGPEEGDNAVKLWDPRSGEELRTLSGRSGGVSSVAFSPDGSLLASGSFDHTVKLWERAEDEQ